MIGRCPHRCTAPPPAAVCGRTRRGWVLPPASGFFKFPSSGWEIKIVAVPVAQDNLLYLHRLARRGRFVKFWR